MQPPYPPLPRRPAKLDPGTPPPAGCVGAYSSDSRRPGCRRRQAERDVPRHLTPGGRSAPPSPGRQRREGQAVADPRKVPPLPLRKSDKGSPTPNSTRGWCRADVATHEESNSDWLPLGAVHRCRGSSGGKRSVARGPRPSRSCRVPSVPLASDPKPLVVRHRCHRRRTGSLFRPRSSARLAYPPRSQRAAATATSAATPAAARRPRLALRPKRRKIARGSRRRRYLVAPAVGDSETSATSGFLSPAAPPPRSDPTAQIGAKGKNRSSPEAGEGPSRNDATTTAAGSGRRRRRRPSSSYNTHNSHNNVCPNFVKEKGFVTRNRN